MNGKMYLLYFDILGFKKLAEEIDSKMGIDERKVRKDFVNIIKERVSIIEKKGKITGKKYGESDDWLLVTDGLDKLFTCILDILNHNTGYKNYQKIPLEIAIGTAKYDKGAKFDGINLISEKSTIEFLKTNIIGYYREWYKKRYKNQSPKSTFIILTESVFQELEPLDRKKCQNIEYKSKEDDSRKESITYFVADVNKFQQRGKVFEFLEKIEQMGNKWYERIDEVYTPPLNYEDIARMLKEKRFVFITGTQELGKTYTAVRLMWKYFNRGYVPRWIKGGEPAERIKVRQRLENITAEIKPKHIIYFEDPFGKRKYEKRESLEREIGTIIDSFKKVEDAYILITSREEVFKEFETEKLSVIDLGEFEKKLNIKKPSYNYGKRKEILLKWAEVENCKWLGNKKLKEVVLKSIENEKNLPTLLGIKNFVLASIDIEKKDKLKEKIQEKSKETAKTFAKEIKNMTEDKILFLSFPFIYEYFEVEFVKGIYQELVKELNLKHVWEFDRILNWFKNDKINVSNNCIEFSHSSYSEALEYILVEDGYITQINNRIFSKLLLKLSEREDVAEVVVWPIAENFDKVPGNVRNLLFKLSEKEEVAEDVCRAVFETFDKIPENIRSKLLFNLSKMGAVAYYFAWAIYENFNKIPENIRNILLLNLSEFDEAAGDIGRAVFEKFDKIPENIRNELLLKLSKMGVGAEHVGRVIVKNFNKVPGNIRNKLLLKLSKKDEAINYVVWAVIENFDKVSEKVRNLLFKLSEKEEVAYYFAWALAEKFDKIPEIIRNKLLLKLADQEQATEGLAWVIILNDDKIPKNIKDGIFFKRFEKENFYYQVVMGMKHVNHIKDKLLNRETGCCSLTRHLDEISKRHWKY